MRIDVVSLFPEFVAQCAGFGVVGRAQERGLLSLQGWNPRDHARGRLPAGGRPSVRRWPGHGDDDRALAGLPGGGAGSRRAAAQVVYLTPQGAPLTQEKVRELAARPRLILLCGRYEGIDERLIAAEVDEEISIGDYVLSGGELAAAVVIDAVARLQEGRLERCRVRRPGQFRG